MSVISFGDVADVIMGQSPDGSTYNKNGVGEPLLNGPADFGGSFPVATQWTTEPNKFADAGDILFCVRGNTLGRQNTADRKYAIGRGLAAIRARKGRADTSFIGFWLLHKAAELLAAGNGSTFPSVSGEHLESLAFPSVGQEQQRQIATRLKAQLAEVETARQAAHAQVRDAVLLRSRLLQQTFANLRDAPRKVLGDWARTTSGSTPPRGDKRYWSPAEIPWVKTGEVAFAPIVITEEAISRQALADCSLMLLPLQTVLIAMYGQGKTRGQSAMLQVEATTNQACFAILPNDTWDADFLHHWLMASYEDLRSLSEGRGGNQANLNGALLNALEIPAPDIDDQRRIVAVLKTQLAEAAAIHQAAAAQLAEIERLPQGLLAQAFDPSTTQGDVT